MVLILFLNSLQFQLGANMANETIIYKNIVLLDVQGLFGGRNIYLSFDGVGFVQLVRPGQEEKRYRIKLTELELVELKKCIQENDFLNLNIVERLGVPDEAYPTIILIFKDGKSKSVSKWANDTNRQFDALYYWILRQERFVENKKPIYSGAYDPKPKEINSLFPLPK